jgi:hypothetical protein
MMMKKHVAKQKFQPLKNNKGFLTLDFIFATILMFSFSALLFMFSITFSAFEVAQYAVFASSRAYFAAAKNEEDQHTAGKEKFEKLIREPSSSLGNVFRNGWFEISDVNIDDFNGDFADDPNSDSATFIGARATVVAKILQVKFPLIGGGAENLSATPASYLMREPTEEECQNFTIERMEKMQQLRPGQFDNPNISAASYAVMMDDGC